MFLVITVLAMLLMGEFAGVIGFNFLGYPYIPGNWLTRALPYLLLGRLLREKRESLLNIPKFIHIIQFVIGGGLVILELFVLARNDLLLYKGHMMGYGVMALVVSFVLAFLISPTRLCDLFFTNWEMRLDHFYELGGDDEMLEGEM